MALTRHSIVLARGDALGSLLHSESQGLIGDPFGFSSIFGAVKKLGSKFFGGGSGSAAGAVGTAISRGSLARGAAGAVGSGLVGAGISRAIGPGGGGGGFQVLTSTRSGKPKLILANGKVVNLMRRRRGISAAALRGAFQLARIAHRFAGVARTGRRVKRK